jgi:hypothetical protein
MGYRNVIAARAGRPIVLRPVRPPDAAGAQRRLIAGKDQGRQHQEVASGGLGISATRPTPGARP